MFWNTMMDQRVDRYDKQARRDPETGILEWGGPRTLGPGDTDRAVLMVHGFAGTPNNFNDLPDRLAEAGWHVRAMLLPGHGTSPREFEQTTAPQLEAAVLAELAALKERFARVALIGHSMGGALATLAAAREQVDFLVLAAPYYRITHQWYYMLRPETWAELLSPRVRWIYRSPAVQPVNLPESREKIISYHWIPTKSALTAMDLAERARSNAVISAVKAPTLLIHSRRDTVTDPSAAEDVFRRLPMPEKRLVWLQRSDHIIFWDYDQDEVAREVLDFLNGRAPA